MARAISRHALSRRANIMIRDEDGMRKAPEYAGIMERLPLDAVGFDHRSATWQRALVRLKRYVCSREGENRG